MSSLLSAILTLPAVLAVVPATQCAPGGNFDMRHWELQLPTGNDNKIDVVRSHYLQGCRGYNGTNFYTHPSTGEIVFTAPGNPRHTGCTTTRGSVHCRTELRETSVSSGRHIAWHPQQTNILDVNMTVVEADDGTYGTTIAQIFAISEGPRAAIYYNRQGRIVIGVKPSAKGKYRRFEIAHVPPGTPFTYGLSYSRSKLSVTINGNQTQLETYGWEPRRCCFKLGNYNQGKSGDMSEVRVAEIKVQH